MNKLTATVAIVVWASAVAFAQPTPRVVTRPGMPSRDVLDRLNLSSAWKIRLPVEGVRDGLFSFQLIPEKTGMQLVVQTLAGAVFLLDAETGDVLWRIQPGIPYWQGQPVGYNSQSIFVVRRDVLYILNRKNGKHRLFTVDKDSKQPEHGIRLQFTPSAAPVADDGNDAFRPLMVISQGNRVTAYDLPDYERAAKAKEIKEGELELEREASLQPELTWSNLDTALSFEQPALMFGSRVAAPAASGLVLYFSKYSKDGRPFFLDDFKTEGNLVAAAAQHGNMMYLGADDATIYALDLNNNRLRWRFLCGGPILRQPAVTNRDVFVSAHRTGLYRIARGSGREVWLNRQAEKFLAANDKFVYALNPQGRLLVLDYAKGTALAGYDLGQWNIHLLNDQTDRIYLAAHDGQVLCLRHRDLTSPMMMKALEPEEPPMKEAPKDKEKDMEKENEKNGKEKDKEKEKVGWLKGPVQLASAGLKRNQHAGNTFAARQSRNGEMEYAMTLDAAAGPIKRRLNHPPAARY